MGASQLWQKGGALDARIHRFTVGKDPQTDLVLLPSDIYGTAAHVRMLGKVGLFPAADVAAVLAELRNTLAKVQAGEFTISAEQEDCHTAIEQALTAACGDAGRNVHLGRSRNDQVLLALRLYMREQLYALAEGTAALASAFIDFAQNNADVLMPGHTHLRRAMPSTGGLWGVAFAEALIEELEALLAVERRLDRCPLGSAAGFGVPLPIDREYVAELLGFSRVQRSVVDVQNSRGRHELALASWIAGVAGVLEKFLWDALLYSTEEFGFLSLPDEFSTGSSIMPQKRNPDVLELARGRCAQLRAWRGELEQLACGHPGNYHRDFQLLKAPLIASIEGLQELLAILCQLVPRLTLNRERCAAACTPELYATQEAYRRVLAQELSFREAYVAVGREVLEGRLQPGAYEAAASHTGSADQLGLPEASLELAGYIKYFECRGIEIAKRLAGLLL